MLTNSALKGKDTGILIKAIFKGNVLILFHLRAFTNSVLLLHQAELNIKLFL